MAVVAICFPYKVHQRQRGQPSASRPCSNHFLNTSAREYCNSLNSANAPWPLFSRSYDSEYKFLQGSIIGIVLLQRPFKRITSVLEISDRHTDVAVSSWGPPHDSMLCSLPVVSAIEFDPVTAVTVEDLEAPHSDLFRLDDVFVQRLRAITGSLAQWELQTNTTLKFAFQPPAPFARLVVQGLWNSLVFPLPQPRSPLRSWFSEITNTAPAKICSNVSADAHLLNPEPLRQFLYRVVVRCDAVDAQDEDACASRIMLEGFYVCNLVIPWDYNINIH
jgi:hypothetical protein